MLLDIGLYDQSAEEEQQLIYLLKENSLHLLSLGQLFVIHHHWFWQYLKRGEDQRYQATGSPALLSGMLSKAQRSFQISTFYAHTKIWYDPILDFELKQWILIWIVSWASTTAWYGLMGDFVKSQKTIRGSRKCRKGGDWIIWGCRRGELSVAHVSFPAGIILPDKPASEYFNHNESEKVSICVMFAGVFISAMFPQSPISHISAQFIQLKYRIPDLMKSCISFLE